MDMILVDLMPTWIRLYETISGENINPDYFNNYDFSLNVKYPQLLNSLIETPGFFRNLPPIPHAINFFNKLLEDGRYEVIVVTQPPRKADYAIKEKREWLQDYFPKLSMTNIVFAHKKYLIHGDILFDDKPSHLEEWKKYHPNGKTATIIYSYNHGIKVDVSFDKETAWEAFYQYVSENL